MKNTVKRLLALLMAAMVLAGGQVLAFASAESSSSSEAEEASAISAEVDNTDGDTDDTTPGLINESPNTGVTAAPIVAAALAIGSIPVILKARKKQ